MSSEYGSATFALPAKDIPSSFPSLDERARFVRAQSERAFELLVSKAGHGYYGYRTRPGHEEQVLKSSLVLVGSSRSAWFEQFMERLIKAHGGSSLELFTTKGTRFPLEGVPVGEGEYSFTQHQRFIVLERAVISELATDIKSLLQWSEANIGHVASVLEGECSLSQLEISVRARTLSHNPAMYHSGLISDEGTGPEYMYLYLRSMLFLLEEALSRGLSVAHFQEQPVC